MVCFNIMRTRTLKRPARSGKPVGSIFLLRLCALRALCGEPSRSRSPQESHPSSVFRPPPSEVLQARLVWPALGLKARHDFSDEINRAGDHDGVVGAADGALIRSEEHTSELQS